MSHLRIKGWVLLVSSGYLATRDLRAQLNENCTVSILNRNVQIKPDGTWVLPNIPANVGRVRARAVCIQNGLTQLGQSDLFTITTNRSLNVNPPVKLGVVTPVPQSLSLTASTTVLNTVGTTVQLTVTATYPDGTTANVTPVSAGTDYTTSNAGVATVTSNGLMTAVASGTAIITAFNEGTSGTISIRVGIPPTITITSPASGATVTEGATITVTATTTGAVAFVTFLANSQVAFTTNAAPYQFAYTVPLGATTMTFGARADNGFGDIGTAQNVQITVARDPRTTVTGRVY
jgi:Bacterial Ig domain/Bacterial Ig-like domain (group 2)